MQTITRNQVQEMLQGDGAEIVEVLGREEFQKFHLPGAMNVPLSDDFGKAIQKAIPDKRTPVIVYCMNTRCNASPKAGRKMEEIGYEVVYDYKAGKEDWKEAGLPVE